MLNPILTSLSLVGLLQAVRTLNPFQLACSFGSFILSLLPGILSQDLELYRLNQALPFFMIAATLGLQALVPPRAGSRTLLLPILLCFASSGLDLYNYAWRYCDTFYAPRIDNGGRRLMRTPTKYS